MFPHRLWKLNIIQLYLNENQEKSSLNYRITLGNIITNVSDRLVAICKASIVDYYTAKLKSSQDYYAFGMLMSGRKF